MAQNYRIAVLMGGVSNEREVSFKSGKAVCQALRDAGHDVVPVDIVERRLDQLDDIRPDAVFNVLHGEFGEDGEVQRLLEEKGIPYTGSGPQASRAGMDKIATKRAFILHSVPTADYFTVEGDEGFGHVSAQAEAMGYPLVCKPACGGSSLGVTIVRKADDLRQSLDAALESTPNDPRVLLERYVRGREFTVGVLDGVPLPVVEVCTKREFFDYEAKYHDEATQYIIPVALLESTYRKVQEAAARAYHALGCRHMSRVDLMCGFDGGLYVLEVNTIPGFTPRSLLPMAAKHAGIEFKDLCDRLVRMAVSEAAGAARDDAERKRHIA